MARKHKKRMKLPNGFGSIRYLGEGRRNPYAVFPPVEHWSPKGPISPKALGYRETWEDAYELLTAYNMEKAGKIKVNKGLYIDRTPTFSEVYERFYDEKFNNPAKPLSKSSANAMRAAYKNCAALHNKQIGQLKYDDLQKVIDSCPLKHSSIELIVTLLKQMYRYALKYEIVDKNYSEFLYISKEDDDESGVPFSDQELKILWEHSDNEMAQKILIMCYSGYRITAFKNMYVCQADKYFRGGVKTKSGKDRIVPIHPAIQQFVAKYDGYSDIIGSRTAVYRESMYDYLNSIGMDRHTPHDCRHTFSRLCEKYGVKENDRKRMMGHSFGGDLTNSVYGHRTVDELRAEIEKIKIP